MTLRLDYGKVAPGAANMNALNRVGISFGLEPPE